MVTNINVAVRLRKLFFTCSTLQGFQILGGLFLVFTDRYHGVMNYGDNTTHIPKPDIFSFSECLHFLDRGYDDCLYSIERGKVIKPLRIDGYRLLLQIRENGDALQVEMLSDGGSDHKYEKAVRYITEWFDLDRDLQPFYRLLKKHDRLSWMADNYYGLRLMGIPDLFEALCWCVIGQQINLTFAYRLKRRLVETYGSFMTYDSKQYHFFPEPEVFAGLEVDNLKELQFSRQKAEYLIGIAKDFAGGKLTKQELASYENTHQMLKRLKKIRGVGDWTANYALMKSLGRTDCITYGDTGLQSAVSKILGLDRKPTREEVEQFFEPFAGWESYLVIYLWRTLS